MMNDIDNLKQALADNCRDLSTKLLGEPNKHHSTNYESRWGSHGSFKIQMVGLRAGRWNDFESGDSGDMLDLITREIGGSFADAASYARNYLGWANDYKPNPEREAQQRAERDRVRAMAEQEHQTVRADKLTAAKAIWQASQSLMGSLAETYLVNRLNGHSIPDAVIETGNLRYSTHPLVHWEDPIEGMAGALLARMVDPLTGDGTGIHRTFVRADGSKIGRKMLGGSGIVKLCDPESQGDALTGIGLGEGLESSLSAMILFDWQPIWASLNSGNMARFPVLLHVEAITLFADHDVAKLVNGKMVQAGQQAAIKCAQRWQLAGRESSIFHAPAVGDDFNNQMKMKEAA